MLARKMDPIIARVNRNFFVATPLPSGGIDASSDRLSVHAQSFSLRPTIFRGRQEVELNPEGDLLFFRPSAGVSILLKREIFSDEDLF